MKAVYLNNFENEADLRKEFHGGYSDEMIDLKGHKILFASYSYENYDGEAFVLTEKDSKLYVVESGHCSCHGLEGTFDPSETTIELIRAQIKDSKLGKSYWYGLNIFQDELIIFLNEYEKCQK